MGLAVSPYGVPIGIRLNDDTHLEKVRALLRELRFDPVEQEQVRFLVSLRVGPRMTRNQRDYHLLYNGISLVERSLSRAAVFAKLRKLLLHLAPSTAPDTFLVPGTIVEVGRSLVVLVDRPGSGEAAGVARMLVDKAGQKPLCEEWFPLAHSGRVHVPGTAQEPTLVVFLGIKSGGSHPSMLTAGQAALVLLPSLRLSQDTMAQGLESVAALFKRASALMLPGLPHQHTADLIRQALE